MESEASASAARRCVLNACVEPQGIGTWVSVAGLHGPQPVCERHWQALRSVYVTQAREVVPDGR